MRDNVALGLAVEAGYQKPLSTLSLGDKAGLISVLTT